MVARAIGGPEFKVRKLMRARIWLGVLIGSTIGGFIPDLWGAGLFSYSSVLLSGVGGLAGLWLSYKTAAKLQVNARKIRVRPLSGAQLLFGYIVH